MALVQALHRAPVAPRLSEHRLTLRDGTELFYRAWLPEQPTTKALLLFHRGHEHSGRWQETVAALGLEDVAVFAWDQRGHGLSPGERGSAPDLATVIHDAEEWVRHLITAHGIALHDTMVLAHSLGAMIATAWVHDYAPPIRGLILATPAFRVKLYVPFAVPLLRLRQNLLGLGVRQELRQGEHAHPRPGRGRALQRRPSDLPADRGQHAARPARHFDALLDDAGAVTAPLLVLAAGSDWVVNRRPSGNSSSAVNSPVKRFEVLPGFSHAIFHEKNRRLVVEKVREFIRERFAQPPSPHVAPRRRPARLHAQRVRPPVRAGRSAIRPRALADEGPGPAEPRHRPRLEARLRLRHHARLHLREPGAGHDAAGSSHRSRLSQRHRLARHSRPASLLEQALRSTIEQTHAAGRPVRLLDIASGPGRYVLETMRRLNTIPMSAVLRDYKQENLEAAARLRDQLGLGDVTLTHGDAFDRASLAAIEPRPTIAIVSGLYELFPDNDSVLRSLRGLADAVEPGGHLLYTNQPWHPQIEFIARVLTNREGQPWIMRRRTQAEMDELVHSRGLREGFPGDRPMGDIHGVGGPARRLLMLRAASDSLLLSLLFVLVYGGTNWFTAQRPDADVKAWYFAWELTVIPYVPLLIVPYMSIDLLFFLARFPVPRRTGTAHLREEGGFFDPDGRGFLPAAAAEAGLAGATPYRRMVRATLSKNPAPRRSSWNTRITCSRRFTSCCA